MKTRNQRRSANPVRRGPAVWQSCLAAALLSLVACSSPPDEATSPTPNPTATPTPEPSTATPGPAIVEQPATLELLDSGTTPFSATLPDHTVVLERDGTILLRNPSDGSLEALPNPAGGLISAVWLRGDPTQEPPEQGGLLVSGQDGYYARVADELVSSPLQTLLADEGPGRLLVTPGPAGEDLWIATPEGLHLYRQGQLMAIEPGTLPTHDALLTWGPWDAGGEALWVASEGALYALIPDGEAFAALPLEDELLVQALCTDASQQVWLLSDGLLYQRTADMPLTPVMIQESTLRLPQDPLPPLEPTLITGLTCGVEGEGAWALTETGLWHIQQAPHASDTHAFINNAPVSSVFLGGDSQGRALFSGAEGTTRAIMGRPTYVVGLDEALHATSPQEVLLLPTLPLQLTHVTATLGGTSLTVEPDPLRLTLDPAAWSSGLYTLVLEATYSDLAGVITTEHQVVLGDYTFPSWEEDIYPIYVRSCAKCHSVSGGVLPLDTAAVWENTIDSILSLVSDGTMPPSGADLTEEEIYTIRSWMEGGFLP